MPAVILTKVVCLERHNRSLLFILISEGVEIYQYYKNAPSIVK